MKKSKVDVSALLVAVSLPCLMLLAQGCSSKDKNGRISAPKPLTNPQAIIIAAEQQERMGNLAKPKVPVYPDTIVLPGTYRPALIDGQMVLRRETDPRTLSLASGGSRVVLGDVSRGEVSYQPGLLPAELATEVARSRKESQAQTKTVIEMMEMVKVMGAEAKKLREQNIDTSRRLEEMTIYAKALDARLRAMPPLPPPNAGKKPKSEDSK